MIVRVSFQKMTFIRRLIWISSISLLLISGVVVNAKSQVSVLFNELPLKPLKRAHFTILKSDSYLADTDSIMVTAYYGSEYDPTTYRPRIISPIEIKKIKSTYYISRIDSVGMLNIDVKLNESTSTFRYWVSPTDFELTLSNHRLMGSNEISHPDFTSSMGIISFPLEVEWSGQMKVIGFDITRISHDIRTEQVHNNGGRFSDESKRLIQHALPGDIYLFENIIVRGPREGELRRKGRSVIVRIIK